METELLFTVTLWSKRYYIVKMVCSWIIALEVKKQSGMTLALTLVLSVPHHALSRAKWPW